jgi:hypothetical protein
MGCCWRLAVAAAAAGRQRRRLRPQQQRRHWCSRCAGQRTSSCLQAAPACPCSLAAFQLLLLLSWCPRAELCELQGALRPHLLLLLHCCPGCCIAGSSWRRRRSTSSTPRASTDTTAHTRSQALLRAQEWVLVVGSVVQHARAAAQHGCCAQHGPRDAQCTRNRRRAACCVRRAGKLLLLCAVYVQA